MLTRKPRKGEIIVGPKAVRYRVLGTYCGHDAILNVERVDVGGRADGHTTQVIAQFGDGTFNALFTLEESKRLLAHSPAPVGPDVVR